MFSKKRGDNMNRLKELREKKGLTLKELSATLKKQDVIISPDSLAKYERGERKPKYDKWAGIAKFYGVSVPYLQDNTFSKTDIFRIMSKEYVSPSSDPFWCSEIDAHLFIIGENDLNDTFTKDEIKNFTSDVEKFFKDNFQFVFFTKKGKEFLMIEKSKKKSVTDKICRNLCDAVDFVDAHLISTLISEVYDEKVKEKLDHFNANKDILLKVSSKADVILETKQLIKALSQFLQIISKFSEDVVNMPDRETARKRLQKFVDSGGKTFE